MRVIPSPSGPSIESERVKRDLPDAVRGDFPALRQEIYGKRLTYLDSAATTLKPKPVVDVISNFYLMDYSNVHRGVHALSQRATMAFEAAREKIKDFVRARAAGDIVFVRGATEGINLVAQTFARERISAGDEVLISAMEHHSNIVPWQILCREKGARLRVIPMNDQGELDLEVYERLLSPRVRMVSLIHVSNALGTINPVKDMIAKAHEKGIPVLIDGAQAAPHFKVDVGDLDCDFYVFSGHKVYGPSGIGVLYGKGEHLGNMPPYQGGGEMILSVTFDKTMYKCPPFRFEAGTPNIAGAVGLGAALDYVREVGLERIARHEDRLLAYATEKLRNIDGLRLIGTAKNKAAVLSFVMEDVHAHDVGTILDHQGVAIRVGHHCAQPAMERFSVPATARASFAIYNGFKDVDALIAGLMEVREVFR